MYKCNGRVATKRLLTKYGQKHKTVSLLQFTGENYHNSTRAGKQHFRAPYGFCLKRFQYNIIYIKGNTGGLYKCVLHLFVSKDSLAHA